MIVNTKCIKSYTGSRNIETVQEYNEMGAYPLKQLLSLNTFFCTNVLSKWRHSSGSHQAARLGFIFAEGGCGGKQVAGRGKLDVEFAGGLFLYIKAMRQPSERVGQFMMIRRNGTF